MKHTPGNWRTGDMFTTVFGPPSGNPAPEIIASNIKKKANAQLIAAAPAMYEALEWARVALKTNDNEYRQVAYSHVAAAIALAEGHETVTNGNIAHD